MSDKTKIRQAYNKRAKSYDEMISLRKWWARLGVRFVWGLPDTAYSARVLDYISDDFTGALLDIPTGTGALTCEKYRRMPKAAVTCADYSENMLAVASERFRQLGIGNVTFKQADAGAMPFDDDTFDLALTMNGLHAFPDKDASFREIRRVLKTGGTLAGCCYVCGEARRTDWIVKNIYTPRGFFTPPYWTKSELKRILRGLFTDVELWTAGAIAGFKCEGN